MRTQLAGSLKAVLAQRLVAAKAGGRIGLFEVLVATPAVANPDPRRQNASAARCVADRRAGRDADFRSERAGPA